MMSISYPFQQLAVLHDHSTVEGGIALSAGRCTTASCLIILGVSFFHLLQAGGGLAVSPEGSHRSHAVEVPMGCA